jgi:hypothetical protein
MWIALDAFAIWWRPVVDEATQRACAVSTEHHALRILKRGRQHVVCGYTNEALHRPVDLDDLAVGTGHEDAKRQVPEKRTVLFAALDGCRLHRAATHHFQAQRIVASA